MKLHIDIDLDDASFESFRDDGDMSMIESSVEEALNKLEKGEDSGEIIFGGVVVGTFEMSEE